MDGSDGHILCFKKKQPCHAGLERLKVIQQAMSNSREWVTEDATEDAVEDAAPESLNIDASDTDAIDVEID